MRKGIFILQLLISIACYTNGQSIVISQVYGAGGNSGSVYNADYVELFNQTGSPINLTGYSIQYAATTGTNWFKADLTGTIIAGGYFLIRMTLPGANGASLPTPDFITATDILMSATAGKITLVNGTAPLSGVCPNTGIIDFVGYGLTTNCYEGTGPTSNISSSLAIFRASNGCIDNNDNSNDFATASPSPRNSASPINLCTTNTITVSGVSGSPFNLPDCFTSASGTVDFTSSGTFTTGNIYTVQLSDASGSFATAVTIGTLSSTANSGTINITIPSGTASGINYKIRIRSSAPVVTSNLSADITVNLTGPCVSAATDFFRSRATGNWNATATWESSATGTAGTWIPATLTPDDIAQVITIRNGHKVNLISSVYIDEVVIENGGILDNQMPISEILTISTGPNDDLEIKSGGVYMVTSTENYSNHITFSTGAVIRVRTNGTIQIGNSSIVGGGNSEYASNSTNFIWDDGSIFLWNSTTTPSIQATFFPGTAPNVIPVFRFNSSPSLSMGGGIPTIINGLLDAAMPILFSGAGSKTFRNGIKGNGKVDGRNGISPSGQFIINGITAELGGTDSLIVPVADGLLIGSATGTTVNLISDKLVHGNVSLLATNSFVDLGTNDLTVTGTISGGSTTSYIRTAGTGSLILNTVDVAGKKFPVGHSKYNPLIIENGNSYEWKVSVYDSITADPPQNTTGAVNVTWQIEPSVNPPASGADITFQFDTTAQVGGSFNVIPYIGQAVQAWHRKDQYYWLAAGAPASLTVIGNTGTVKALGLTEFCPYALARTGLPLPIKLIRFDAIKISSSASRLSWELAACCSSAARFEIERSTDARNYSLLSSLPGNETNRFYAYTDTRLARGITYYRLKMTDADGKISYSNVVAIINDKAGLLITSLSPNPVQSQATLTITNAATGPVQFAIYDLRGRVVQQWLANTDEGSTTFILQLGGLRAGLYHLLASGAGARSVYRKEW